MDYEVYLHIYRLHNKLAIDETIRSLSSSLGGSTWSGGSEEDVHEGVWRVYFDSYNSADLFKTELQASLRLYGFQRDDYHLRLKKEK